MIARAFNDNITTMHQKTKANIVDRRLIGFWHINIPYWPLRHINVFPCIAFNPIDSHRCSQMCFHPTYLQAQWDEKLPTTNTYIRC